MNKKSIDRGRALEVILPVGVVVVASFAGIHWLGTAGTLLLGIVIARALLRVRDDSTLPTMRGFWVAIAALVIVGASMVALFVGEMPTFVVIAGLAVGMVAAYVALGYVVWWLVRLNNG